MDLSKVIKDRRSIRRYKKDPVADDGDPGVHRGRAPCPVMGKHAGVALRGRQRPAIKEALTGTLGSSNPARQAMLDAPCVVCLVCQRNVAGMKKGEAMTDKGDWFMFDGGIAMEHLVLTAWSLGLGTVHIGAFDQKRPRRYSQCRKASASSP